jgi:hypothetical protein
LKREQEFVSMSRLLIALALSISAWASVCAQEQHGPEEFFPMSVGTYWLYEGTVSWADSASDEPVKQQISWKMSVNKVIRRNDLVAAIVTGFPADLDFSAGAAVPLPWLILQDAKHNFFHVNLGPNYDLTKFDAPDPSFTNFMDTDALLFQWPLRKGAKFCDDEAKAREDNMYCWVVSQETTKPEISIKGAPRGKLQVFVLQYRSLPDDTTMELVPGLGLLSYEYHHHGTVADTELRLVEFHRASNPSPTSGSQP